MDHSFLMTGRAECSLWAVRQSRESAGRPLQGRDVYYIVLYTFIHKYEQGSLAATHSTW